MNDRSIREILEGQIIYYRLAPKDRPTNPAKEWRGRVKQFIPATPNMKASVVVVESLEPGYEEQVEYIIANQVTRIEQEREQPA